MANARTERALHTRVLALLREQSGPHYKLSAMAIQKSLAGETVRAIGTALSKLFNQHNDEGAIHREKAKIAGKRSMLFYWWVPPPDPTTDTIRELENDLDGERRHADLLAETIRLLVANLDDRDRLIVTHPNVAMITLGDFAAGALALHRERCTARDWG